MRIVFDGSGTGYGNNGGTLTNFKSAEALAEQGHEVYLLGGTNNFTWFGLKHARYTSLRPSGADITIATGWKSTDYTMKYGSGLRIWWVRGWETWSAPENIWLRKLEKFPNIVANSIGLANRIEYATGRKVGVVYPGVDKHEMYPDRKSRDWKGIGMLYSPSKKSKNMKMTKLILNTLHERGYKTFMFGNHDKPNGYKCKYKERPSINEKRKLYNLCDVWIAVSESEGMHLPPTEAGMCGCVLVCTGAPYGGTSDYAIDGETAVVLDGNGHCNDYMEYIIATERILNDDVLRTKLAYNLHNKLKRGIGSREKNMRRFVQLMEGMR